MNRVIKKKKILLSYHVNFLLNRWIRGTHKFTAVSENTTEMMFYKGGEGKIKKKKIVVLAPWP